MKENQKWEALLALSTPTFAGETMPPYGFMTRMLAELKAEKRQEQLMEKIGLRALLASLTVLGATAVLTVGVYFHNQLDLEPGMRSIIQVENVQVS